METSLSGYENRTASLCTEERKHNNLEPTEETLSLKPLGHVVRPQGEPNNPLRIEWRIFLILWFL